MKNNDECDVQTRVVLDNTPLERVTVIKFLGIFLDEKLCWKNHISEKSKQISKVIGIMNKLKNYLPLKVLRTIYQSLIQSNILYGLIIWGKINSNQQHNRIQALQKRAIRIICGKKYNAHTDPLFKSQNILKFYDLYKLQGIKLYGNIIDKKCPKYLQNSIQINSSVHEHTCNARHASNIYRQHASSRYDAMCLSQKLYETWNSLPAQLRQIRDNISTNRFIVQVKKFLSSEYNTVCNITNCYVCQKNQI